MLTGIQHLVIVFSYSCKYECLLQSLQQWIVSIGIHSCSWPSNGSEMTHNSDACLSKQLQALFTGLNVCKICCQAHFNKGPIIQSFSDQCNQRGTEASDAAAVEWRKSFLQHSDPEQMRLMPQQSTGSLFIS